MVNKANHKAYHAQSENHKPVRSELCRKGSSRLVCAQLLSRLCIHTLLPFSQTACISLPLHVGLGHGVCFTWRYIRRSDGVPFLITGGLTDVLSASQVSAVAMKTCSHGDCWAFSLDSRGRCVGGPGPQVWCGKQCHPHPAHWRFTEPLKTHRHGSEDRYLVLKPWFGDGCHAAMSNWHRGGCLTAGWG